MKKVFETVNILEYNLINHKDGFIYIYYFVYQFKFLILTPF